MIVYTEPGEIPADFAASAVTIGKFDGVHAGHRAVLSRLMAVAAERGLVSVAVTFDRHPLAYHAPQSCPASLVSAHQKVELLERTGLDAAIVLHYGRALASQSAEQFVAELLVGRLHARVLLVGRDFRYGAGNTGDIHTLTDQGARLGFEVIVIDDVVPEDQRRVSSTWIRELLEHGDVAHARRLLGHLPAVSGEVVHGFERGRQLGYPTANLAADVEGFIPADGVYAGWLVDSEGTGLTYPAAISVGHNPTFDDVSQRQVEAYVLDETDLDLYGHRVELQFAHRIRDMVAFGGIESLTEKIADDVERVRAALAA